MSINWTQINADFSGTPRFVCHFLNLNTREELDRSGDEWIGIHEKYNLALARARKIHGRKFHNKQFGGGIVFRSWNIQETEAQIRELTGRDYDEVNP